MILYISFLTSLSILFLIVSIKKKDSEGKKISLISIVIGILLVIYNLILK